MTPGYRFNLFFLSLLILSLITFLFWGCGKDGQPPPSEPQAAEPKSPSPSDGKGKATLAPPLNVQVCERRSWHIDYTAGKEGIQSGGGVWIQVPQFWFWTPPQAENPSQPGYVTASTTSSGAAIELEALPSGQSILVRVKEGFLGKGEKIRVVYGDDGGGKNPAARARADRFAEEGERFFVKVDGDGDGFFHPIASHPTFNVLPGEFRGFTISSPSFVNIDEPFQVSIAALDAFRNRAEHFSGAAKLFCLQGEDVVTFPKEVVFAEVNRGAVRVEVCAKKEGIFNLVVELEDSSSLRVSNPILAWKELPEFNLFWGDLQGHSNWSDGSASPRQFHEYARDVAGLQVVALTDHDRHGFIPLDEAPNLWNELKKTASSFNSPGDFVAFSAFEWTSWKYGHKHVLYLKDDGPLLCNEDPRYNTPAKLWKGLEGHEALTISHHTGWGDAATDWSFYDSRFETLVEIYSVHGSCEHYGCDECVRNPAKGSFVHDALARGYRLGIVGSGDTHSGHPGLSGPPVLTGGLAGIYARELTREGIFEALRARRTYGTSGSRIILDFRVNDTMMGSVLPLSSPDELRVISVMAVGHKAIGRIDVLKNNRVVFSQEGKGVAETLSLQDPEPAKEGDFYSARIIQSDKEREKAWSSPIWIDLKP